MDPDSELAASSERLQIARALGDIALIEWLNRHARDLRGSERLAWITGWTSDMQGIALRRALDVHGVRYVLRLSDAPAGADAPMIPIHRRSRHWRAIAARQTLSQADLLANLPS